MADPRRVAEVTPRRTVLFILKTSEGGRWTIPQAVALRAAGFHVEFLLPHSSGSLVDALREHRFQTHFLQRGFTFSSPWAAINTIQAVRRVVTEHQPDLIFSHLYASGLASRLATVGYRGRPVTMHMIPGPLHLEMAVIRATERLLTRRDDVLISASEYTYRAYEPLVSARTQHVMIPYGTRAPDPSHVPTRLEARQRLKAPLDAFVVVMVAYFYAPKAQLSHAEGIKGHETLLNSWRQFAKNKQNALLFIVGSGFDSAGEKYREEVVAAHNQDRVIFVDTVSDVGQYYAMSDLSVSPSLSENHGAAMEAGRYARPSVVSAAGGLPEMLHPALADWAVEPGNIAGLADALERAYEEWIRGSLDAAGDLARKHIVQGYEAGLTAARVVNIASRQFQPKVSLFTDAHLLRDRYGAYGATDGVNGDKQWARYVPINLPLTVVARTATAEGVLPEDADPVRVPLVRPLREFSGPLGLLRSGPSLLFRVDAQVRRSDLNILRLPSTVGTIAGLLSIVRGVPYAAEIVGDVDELRRAGFARDRTTRVALSALHHLTKLVVRRASAARYVTEETLQKTYPTGAPLTSACSNVLIEVSDRVAEPRTAPSPDGQARLLAVGTQATPYKAHDDAIRVVAALRNDHGQRARLDLVGDGSLQPALKALAKDLGVSDLVVFHGHLSRPAVLQMMDTNHVLLQLSLTEGLPRTVIEAYARALPVVATHVAGNSELVPGHLLVPTRSSGQAAQTVLRLLGSPASYEAASAYGLDKSAQYERPRLDVKFATWLAGLRQIAEKHDLN